jgi:hypothetical protein
MLRGALSLAPTSSEELFTVYKYVNWDLDPSPGDLSVEMSKYNKSPNRCAYTIR